jgi:hypothetical protein
VVMVIGRNSFGLGPAFPAPVRRIDQARDG